MAVWKQIWARTVNPRSLEAVSQLARCCCTHEQGLHNCFPILQEIQNLCLAWRPWRLRRDRLGSAGSYLRPASKTLQSKAGELSAFGFAVLAGEPPDDRVRCGLHLGGAVRWRHILRRGCGMTSHPAGCLCWSLASSQARPGDTFSTHIPQNLWHFDMFLRSCSSIILTISGHRACTISYLGVRIEEQRKPSAIRSKLNSAHLTQPLPALQDWIQDS